LLVNEGDTQATNENSASGNQDSDSSDKRPDEVPFTINITGADETRLSMPTALTKVNTATSIVNLAWGAKVSSFEWSGIMKSSKYLRGCRNIGLLGSAVNLVYSTAQIGLYAHNGGSNPMVYQKLTTDILMTTFPFVINNPYVAIVYCAVSTVYLGMDIKTKGFGTDKLIEDQIHMRK
ncbi:MAG: hypothetical protein K2F67_08690, partial [Eubacterium sp.]|nr:hypothetical protein [Eubacterium sp.]